MLYLCFDPTASRLLGGLGLEFELAFALPPGGEDGFCIPEGVTDGAGVLAAVPLAFETAAGTPFEDSEPGGGVAVGMTDALDR